MAFDDDEIAAKLEQIIKDKPFGTTPRPSPLSIGLQRQAAVRGKYWQGEPTTSTPSPGYSNC